MSDKPKVAENVAQPLPLTVDAKLSAAASKIPGSIRCDTVDVPRTKNGKAVVESGYAVRYTPEGGVSQEIGGIGNPRLPNNPISFTNTSGKVTDMRKLVMSKALAHMASVKNVTIAQLVNDLVCKSLDAYPSDVTAPLAVSRGSSAAKVTTQGQTF